MELKGNNGITPKYLKPSCESTRGSQTLIKAIHWPLGDVSSAAQEAIKIA